MKSCFALAATFVVLAEAFTSSKREASRSFSTRVLSGKSMSWSEIESILDFKSDAPISIDSVLDPHKPNFSSERPTLMRERHGWCPYSERVWLTMELANMEYDTVRIDNTGGPRPEYFAGQTPQMKWPDGKTQGESMDLVCEIDRQYAGGKFQSDSSNAQEIASKFRSIFPSARPSSRAAFLFQMNGEPLWKSTFEATLQKTDELLGSSNAGGPFFLGSEITIADIAWAPFLERYRYQLPCLHEGLDPADASAYPHLCAWYEAMDQDAEYACRVKGDASSWRKVLSMAGFGNSGLPPQIKSNMDNLIAKEEATAQASINLDLWRSYARSRPYVQDTPQKEAAAIMTRNHKVIIQDTINQATTPKWKHLNLPESEKDVDAALRNMVLVLAEDASADALWATSKDVQNVQKLASFLDLRMCVPRDMGAMAAATIKNLAVELR